jgi:uncharacterized membrane protein
MSNLRNWALGSAILALLLVGPIVALLTGVAAEMLSDVLTQAGVAPVCIAAAGAIGWVLLRKYQPELGLNWGRRRPVAPSQAAPPRQASR